MRGLPARPSSTFCSSPRRKERYEASSGLRSSLTRTSPPRPISTSSAFREEGERGRYVTSICTGAVLAGAAGLLKGYRDTTHWLSLDLIPLVGAIPVNERAVKDRNRITSAGITAGIDLALALVGEISGERQATEIELMLQYDPALPFKSSSLAIAEATLVQEVSAARRGLQDERRAFFAMLEIGKALRLR
jgi:cyclohexyl-isocyanide hydratase